MGSCRFKILESWKFNALYFLEAFDEENAPTTGIVPTEQAHVEETGSGSNDSDSNDSVFDWF